MTNEFKEDPSKNIRLQFRLFWHNLLRCLDPNILVRVIMHKMTCCYNALNVNRLRCHRSFILWAFFIELSVLSLLFWCELQFFLRSLINSFLTQLSLLFSLRIFPIRIFLFFHILHHIYNCRGDGFVDFSILAIYVWSSSIVTLYLRYFCYTFHRTYQL